MNTLINYLLELNLGLIFFYGVYRVLLRKETQFTITRWYLLTAMACSILFPLLTVSSGQNTVIPSLSNTVPAHWLPEVVIGGSEVPDLQQAPTNYWSWIIAGYLVVASIFVMLLFVRICSIIRLFAKAKRYVWKSYTVAETSGIQGVFSFFNIIFWGGNNQIDSVEKEEILNHEAIHIQQGHSFDVILIHLLQAVCWFNPIIWFYKTSLVQVHEFEADARSVEHMHVDRYCTLLAKVALQQNGFVLANHFTNSFTLKRINMMKTLRKKISKWKMATAISMLATYFVVVACQDQLESVKEVTDNSTMALSYPLEVRTELEKARQGNPGTEFYVLEMNEAGKKKMEEVIKELQINSLEGRPVIVKEGSEVRNFFIYKKTGQVSVINSLTVSEDGVHTVVEQSAEPKGGMTEFYKYIATTLKYPAEARKKGVEGRVFIEFVINEDGSISNARPLKGVGAGCDEEALRVVANSPAWTPAMQDGKIVKQRIVLPIVFRLDNPKTESDNTNP
ncbi:MAG: hypothetical protein BroJett042_02690 [Bacteroidota bacterium]|nr:MAG: hypothetical protein BroJett042_02690 [Bacteroidota bacterium]